MHFFSTRIGIYTIYLGGREIYLSTVRGLLLKMKFSLLVMWKKLEKYAPIVAAYLLGLFILIAPPITGFFLGAEGDFYESRVDKLSGLVFGVLIAVAGLFIYLFTGVICKRRMVWMIRYSYLFIPFILLMVTAVPFVVAKNAPFLNRIMHHNTIGVVKACREELQVGNNKKQELPVEIGCSKDSARYQWVINVGGHFTNSEPDSELREQARIASGAAITLASNTMLDDFAYENKPTHMDEPQTGYGFVSTYYGARAETTPIATESSPGKIQGGLVVPLYIVVIALLGGAVSMMRRVPVIQRQVWDWFKQLEDGNKEFEHEKKLPVCMPDGPLRPEDARECLIFQMMQVVSAPLIAMMAYYFLAPHFPSFPFSVGLAFISGYASETILVLTMAKIDKWIQKKDK